MRVYMITGGFGWGPLSVKSEIINDAYNLGISLTEITRTVSSQTS